MSEHDDIEKKLGDYRESRDRGLPADRRLLPVHKDRLLAEARRRYVAQGSPGWSGFFRPAIRWAMVAAPLLILALAGYFWFQDSALKRSELSGNEGRLALAKADKPAVTRKRVLSVNKEADAEGNAVPAGAAVESERNEATLKDALSNQPVAGQAALPASPPVATMVPLPEESIQTALLDLSGQYRSRSESKVARTTLSDDRDSIGYGKDQKSAEKAVAADESLRGGAGGKSVSNFSNFKLVQSANTITLVDEAGSTYVGQLVQPQQVGNLQPGQAKAKIREKQNVSSIIQQANLVGTNQMTREVVSLVANFYVEPPPVEAQAYRRTESATGRRDVGEVSGSMQASKPEPKPVAPELPEKKLADKLQQAQSRASNVQTRVSNVQAPGRVNVVLERIDPKNNRQERVAEAEKVAE